MVIDSSALLAIFLVEPDRERILNRILMSETRRISAANLLETGITLESRNGEASGRELDLFLNQAQIEVVPVDAEQVEIARVAWRKYGKGRHPAALNFGDCFAYALAATLDEPLLAIGMDFRRTDITLAELDSKDSK
jgi:ribonuclease VapC